MEYHMIFHFLNFYVHAGENSLFDKYNAIKIFLFRLLMQLYFWSKFQKNIDHLKPISSPL